MGANATGIAVVNAEGKVVTIVRLDVPEGWQPPDGCTAIPDDELPEGWQMAEYAGPVPSSVTARQIRLWLVAHGISMAAVESAIDAISDEATRNAVRVEWEYAPYVERSHPWLVPMAQAIGLNEAAVDQAFREASGM